MNKPKIKIHLEVIGNSLVYAVLEQDESLRATETEYWMFKATNGWCIESCDNPYLASPTIYIRGLSPESDFIVGAAEFSNAQNAAAAKVKILEAFAEWAANGYFDGKKEVAPKFLPGNVYEF